MGSFQPVDGESGTGIVLAHAVDDRAEHIVDFHVFNQHVFRMARSIAPSTRLQHDAVDTLLFRAAGAVHILPGTVDEATFYNQVGAGFYHPDTVAGGVQFAVFNQHIRPIATGKRIIKY